MLTVPYISITQACLAKSDIITHHLIYHYMYIKVLGNEPENMKDIYLISVILFSLYGIQFVNNGMYLQVIQMLSK